GTVDVPALIMRRAPRLLRAAGAGRRRGAVDGHPLLLIDQVQRQPFPLRAVVVVRVRVIVEAVLAVAPRPLEMDPRQPLHQPRAGQHDDRVTQKQRYFQVRGQAQQRVPDVHDSPSTGTASSPSLVADTTSRNSGLSWDSTPAG